LSNDEFLEHIMKRLNYHTNKIRGLVRKRGTEPFFSSQTAKSSDGPRIAHHVPTTGIELTSSQIEQQIAHLKEKRRQARQQQRAAEKLGKPEQRKRQTEKSQSGKKQK
jgi:hypothetical protein